MAERSRERGVFRETSEMARAWAGALQTELAQWPGVRVKRSFGMSMVYRGETIFACLPGTRMIHSENAIMLKFQQIKPALARRMVADARFVTGSFDSGRRKGEGLKWRLFLLREDGDVHGAIEWLAEAYRNSKPLRNRQAGGGK